MLHLDDGGAAHPTLGLATSRSNKWTTKNTNEECSVLSIGKKNRYNYTLKNINLGYSNSEGNLCVLWCVNKSITSNAQHDRSTKSTTNTHTNINSNNNNNTNSSKKPRHAEVMQRGA